MSKNLDQIYTANPTTTIGSSDLIYIMKSPYNSGTDAAMIGSTLNNLFANLAGTNTSGEIPYFTSANTIEGNSNFTYNGSVISSSLPLNAQGRVDGSSVPAGKVGEIVNILQSSGITPSTLNGVSDILSYSFSPGIWKIDGNVFCNGGNFLNFAVWSSTTSGTLPSFAYFNQPFFPFPTGTINNLGASAPTRIYNFTSNTIVYISIYLESSVSPTAYGQLIGTRIG